MTTKETNNKITWCKTKKEKEEKIMPFRSAKQRAYLYANKPEMAKKWASEHGNKIVKMNKGGYIEVKPRGLAEC